MALGDYTKTVWDFDTPNLTPTNHNNFENKIEELDAWADTADGDIIGHEGRLDAHDGLKLRRYMRVNFEGVV